MAKLILDPSNGKVRNLLLQVGWQVGGAITMAHGYAIIAKGKCPTCTRKWTKEHRKCVPGLFPGEDGQCGHRECGF